MNWWQTFILKVQENEIAVSVAVVLALALVGGTVFWLLVPGSAVKKAKAEKTIEALSLPFESEEILAHYNPTSLASSKSSSSSKKSSSSDSDEDSEDGYKITPQNPYSVTMVISDTYSSGVPSNESRFGITSIKGLYIYVRWVGLSGYHISTVNLYDPGGHLYMPLSTSFHCSEKWQDFQGRRLSILTGTQEGKSYCWVKVWTPFGAGTWAESMPGNWKAQAHLDNTGTVWKEASFTLSQ